VWRRWRRRWTTGGSDESGSVGAEDKAGVCAGKQHRDILPNVPVLLRGLVVRKKERAKETGVAEGGKVSVWESEAEGRRRVAAGANNGGKTKTGVVRWIE
jgi:hypothetical protein